MSFILTSLIPSLRTGLPQILATIWTVPISVALLLFLIRARKGFALHGATAEPIYLPQSFGEAIEYIREAQGKVQSNISKEENALEVDMPE